MYLPVKLIATPVEEPCSVCTNRMPGLFGRSVTFDIFIGNGVETSDPICLEHLIRGQPIDVRVEQTDITKGRRTPDKRIRRRSQRQERKLAEDSGGRVQKGSGCLPWAKGDVRKRGVFRGESKFTTAQSFSLKRALLDKIRSECEGQEYPLLDIEFINKGTQRSEDRWVAVPYEVWVELNASKDSGPRE